MTGLKLCAGFLILADGFVIVRRIFVADYLTPLDLLSLVGGAFVAGVCLLAIYVADGRQANE